MVKDKLLYRYSADVRKKNLTLLIFFILWFIAGEAIVALGVGNVFRVIWGGLSLLGILFSLIAMYRGGREYLGLDAERMHIEGPFALSGKWRGDDTLNVMSPVRDNGAFAYTIPVEDIREFVVECAPPSGDGSAFTHRYFLRTDQNTVEIPWDWIDLGRFIRAMMSANDKVRIVWDETEGSILDMQKADIEIICLEHGGELVVLASETSGEG